MGVVMAALRVSRPGLPTDYIDLGPAVGRVTHTRGVIYGGVIVVADPVPPISDAEKARRAARKAEIDRAYYERDKAAAMERQRQYRARLRAAL